MSKLTNVNVQFISLVRRGANKRSIVWKSADATRDAPHLKTAKILKTNDEKRLVYGVVYAPDDIDMQGDWMTADEIERAAHSFMKRLALHNVDKDHNYEPIDNVYVAESYIIRGSDPEYPKEKAGTWVVTIKIDHDETWQAVKSGEIGGLSLAGYAQSTEEETQKDDESSLLRKVFGALLGLQQKHKEKEMDEQKVKDMIQKEFADLKKALGVGEKEKNDSKDSELSDVLKKTLSTGLAEIKKELEDQKKEIEILKKQSPGSAQDSNEPTEADLAKEDKIVEAMVKAANEAHVQ